MHEIAFRFRHGCPVSQLSEAYPDVALVQWCNYQMEVLEVHTASEQQAEAMRKDYARFAGRGQRVLQTHRGGGGVQTWILRCPHGKSKSVPAVIERHHALYVPPLHYSSGWENYRIVALDPNKTVQLFAALRERGEVEIVKKRPLDEGPFRLSFLVSTNELLADMTEKQAGALLTAIQHGYYTVPRKIRTEDIARARKVPRTTFEEHVRKAESKLLTSMAPYVALYVGGTK